ncbi:Choline dehydrogenase [Streptoalloteichus tenebrarius]|uniref:Choline dehydrogenase n=1 Tax=Streptoalloteichus tenebrarius (strain ATCC 17920 / DSM 40477 / JCM 4838 / CBS 697.72 / NBRC 16177 / NCIMB 11028 / NRRL B-12390 / A12253. 1 / ISP 5477) TaxID=1933 RepID=Q2MFI8_STRSD|nr:GMC family oxidoreductase [Streptoalloteichus tenebrarius]MCP2261353.1 Choline dehydrogenase [Streptoalloteichus tenebrarius]BFF00890.1 GMC family oxidoreductase [Streptoalloteichus tenebrarius]CAF33053.1 putative aminoglycoside 6'-dehydrogenase [Streptoalloteichus tenebrarius]
MRFVTLQEATAQVFDVCIIGSGASGAVTAFTLAERGMSVLIVEQGDVVPPGSTIDDHLDPDSWAYAWRHGRWWTTGNPWTAQAFGGGTIFYAGVSFRYHPRDLTPSPEFLGAAAYDHWGVTRQDLDPYYDWIEEQLAVAGPSGATVAEYQFPRYRREKLDYTSQGRVLAEAATRLGWTPVATPLAISGVRDRFTRGCQQLTPCTDNACPVGAKADVASRLLSRCGDNLSVLLRTRAARLVASRPGTVDSVEVLHAVERDSGTIRARRFVLAANAIQSSALLLRSASRLEPDGMGNSSGMVGQHLAMKNSVYLRTHVRREDDYQPLRHRYSSMTLLDSMYDPAFPDGMGGLIYEANPWDNVRDNAFMPLQLECSVGDRPRARNQIRLSKDLDSYGLPRVVMDYVAHRRDLARLRLLRERAKALLRSLGGRVRHVSTMYELGSSHLHGTLRSGRDPRSSVTDPLGRLHDYDNVWAVDGAVFPFAGNLNPTLTIQANARRIACAIS